MKNKENDILCPMNEDDFVYRQLSNFATTMSISNIYISHYHRYKSKSLRNE